MGLIRLQSSSLPSGSVIGHAKSYYTTKNDLQGTATFSDTATINYTPKSSNSVLRISAVFHISGEGSFRCVVDNVSLGDPTNHYMFFDVDVQNSSFSNSERQTTSPCWFYTNTSTASKTIKVQFRSYDTSGPHAIAVNELHENVNFSHIEIMEIAG